MENRFRRVWRVVWAATQILAVALVTAVTAAAGTVAPSPHTEVAGPTDSADGASFSVLVFSKTAGLEHPSIPFGQAAITAIGNESGFSVVLSEDATLFTDEALSTFAAVVFLNTAGDILDETQQGAFERYIEAGGGWVGIHSAAVRAFASYSRARACSGGRRSLPLGFWTLGQGTSEPKLEQGIVAKIGIAIIIKVPHGPTAKPPTSRTRTSIRTHSIPARTPTTRPPLQSSHGVVRFCPLIALSIQLSA